MDAQAATKAVLGKKIVKIDYTDGDTGIKLTFWDGTILHISDENRNCCEHRYMTTPDNFLEFVGTCVLRIEERDGPDVGDAGGDVHETMFLDILTTSGSLNLCSHNEHNGYYGGLSLTYGLSVDPTHNFGDDNGRLD